MRDEDLFYGILSGLEVSISREVIVDAVAACCGYNSEEEDLSGKLWQYAYGDIPETEADALWEHVQGCEHCLREFGAIQRAVEFSNEAGYSLEQIQGVLKKNDSTSLENASVKKENDAEKEKILPNVMRVALTLLRGAIEVLRTDGLLQPLKPIPAVRGTRKNVHQVIRICKEMERCSVALTAEKDVFGECSVELKILPLPREIPKKIRVDMTARKRLLASYEVVNNEVSFGGISSGNYRLEIFGEAGLWGQIILDID